MLTVLHADKLLPQVGKIKSHINQGFSGALWQSLVRHNRKSYTVRDKEADSQSQQLVEVFIFTEDLAARPGLALLSHIYTSIS